MTMGNTIRLWIQLLIMVLVIGVSDSAMAQSDDFLTNQPDGLCTTSPQFNPSLNAEDGILTTITLNVKRVLNGIIASMYTGIVNNDGFRAAVASSLTLYFVIYGLLFMFGMVQATLFDFAMRMIKVVILAALLSPESYLIFDHYVVNFFETSMDELIQTSTSVAFNGGGGPIIVGENGEVLPFVKIDEAIHEALSAKMAVTMLAIFFTGPYGIVIGFLMMIALGSFVTTLLTAIWVYLMALVVRTLLFGIAPIFIACILFDRTRYLFQGWVNQIINSVLQPVLLFIFFGFFVSLMTISLANILKTPVCWTESVGSASGTPFYIHFWRFTIPTDPDTSGAIVVHDAEGNEIGWYEIYNGSWDFFGPNGIKVTVDMPKFPIEIVAVLSFLILTELAVRFNRVVIMIAQDLAGASVSFATMNNPLNDLMSGGKGGGGGGGGSMPGGNSLQGLASNTADAGKAGGAANVADQARGGASPVGKR